MPTYTAPVEDMMFLFDNLKDNKNYKEIDKFKEINHTDLRNNLKNFLVEIFPILKEHKIKYCIHPDDPPYNIFGLPRIMSNENDIKYLTSIFKHENNVYPKMEHSTQE